MERTGLQQTWVRILLTVLTAAMMALIFFFSTEPAEKSDATSITIRNKGTRHGELRQIKNLVCNGKPLEQWFDKADLEKVVLAGSTRKFQKASKTNSAKK